MDRSDVILFLPSKYMRFRNWMVPQAKKKVPRSIRSQLAINLPKSPSDSWMSGLMNPFIDHPGTMPALSSNDEGEIPTFKQYYKKFAPSKAPLNSQEIEDAVPGPADAIESQPEDFPSDEEAEEEAEKNEQEDHEGPGETQGAINDTN